MIKLLGPENLAEFDQLGASESAVECQKLKPFVFEGVLKYIANAQTKYFVLKLNDEAFPVSVNETEWNSCYVVSPFTHYITYCCVELYLLKFKPLQYVLTLFIKTIGIALRQGKINKNVHINNYLLSTNLYPELSDEGVKEIRDFMVDKYPDHTLIFRSVNSYPDGSALEKFKKNGFFPVASRQLYIQDPERREVKISKSYKKDISLFKRSGYEIVSAEAITESDLPRILELYNFLYIDKYSELNPQFTLEYLRWAKRTRFLKIHVLKKEGKIDGVVGYYRRGRFMTTPLFGYDTHLPVETGLYRLLSTLLIDHARDAGLLLNASSGASEFKRARGGVVYSEFNLVYTAHLSFGRRATWAGLRIFTNSVVLPVLRKLKL